MSSSLDSLWAKESNRLRSNQQPGSSSNTTQSSSGTTSRNFRYSWQAAPFYPADMTPYQEDNVQLQPKERILPSPKPDKEFDDSSLGSRWATPSDRIKAEQGLPVTRYTGKLNRDIFLHPEATSASSSKPSSPPALSPPREDTGERPSAMVSNYLQQSHSPSSPTDNVSLSGAAANSTEQSNASLVVDKPWWESKSPAATHGHTQGSNEGANAAWSSIARTSRSSPFVPRHSEPSYLKMTTY